MALVLDVVGVRVLPLEPMLLLAPALTPSGLLVEVVLPGVVGTRLD
jgi:hypothetical protein